MSEAFADDVTMKHIELLRAKESLKAKYRTPQTSGPRPHVRREPARPQRTFGPRQNAVMAVLRVRPLCWVSVAEIAALTGMERTYVSRALAALRARGAIQENEASKVRPMPKKHQRSGT